MLLIFSARANYSTTQNGKCNRVGIGNELVRMAATNYRTNKIYIPIRVRFTLRTSRRMKTRKRKERGEISSAEFDLGLEIKNRRLVDSFVFRVPRNLGES